MVDLVVWTGPVAAFQVRGATVPGAKELFLACRGDKGPHAWCPAVGAELAGSPDLLLSRAKLAPGDLGRLFFGAFSAGGSVLRRLLYNPDYRAITTAVLLSDATFTASWLDQKRRRPPPIEPFVIWALDVLDAPGSKMFVATASPSPNGPWATGVENLAALRTEIEERSGRRFERLSHFFGVEPGPENAYQLGDVILAEFPMKPLGHGHTKIAPQVWQNILVPFLEGTLPDPAPPVAEPDSGEVLIPVTVPIGRPARAARPGAIAAAVAALTALTALVVGLGRRRKPKPPAPP